MRPRRSQLRSPPATARWLARLVVALACVPLVPLVAHAQGTISGTVTAARSGEPIEAVALHLEGTQRGALTGPVGAYRIINVPAGPYVLTARRIGYAQGQQRVTVGASGAVTVDFTLERTATTLGEIVVTGTPMEQSKRQLGNSVGTVKATEIQAIAPEPNVQ